MPTVKETYLTFLEEAKAWRDARRAEGLPAHTYRDCCDEHIALFLDDSDDIVVCELASKVFFSNVS